MLKFGKEKNTENQDNSFDPTWEDVSDVSSFELLKRNSHSSSVRENEKLSENIKIVMWFVMKWFH